MRPQPASSSASAKSCASPAPARGRSRPPKGRSHTGRAVVIATGLTKGRLGLPEEDELRGPRPLALRLLRRPALCRPAGHRRRRRRLGALRSRGAEGIRQRGHRDRHGGGRRCPTASAAWTAASSALEGSDGLQSVVVESAGARKTIPTSAVFVYVGQSPAAEFVPDSLARDATGHIVVDARGPHLRCRRRLPSATCGPARAIIWPTPSPTASVPAQAVVAALARTS